MEGLYGNRGDGNRDILLTFDDGPSSRNTAKVLDILSAHDIKAMFLVLGSLLAKSAGRTTASRVHAEGHILGNHSFSHQNLRGLPRDKVDHELRRTHELICDCTGECTYFRPPYGSTDDVVSEVALEFGYTTVGWTVDTLDWRLKDNGAWVDHGMEQIEAREDSIVLMHDIHKSTGDHLVTLIHRITDIPGYRFALY